MPLKLFGHTGLRVSAVCLRTMTFGEARGWGADKSASRAVFERFVQRGGNFSDTANNYMNGASEEFLGEFISDTPAWIVAYANAIARQHGWTEFSGLQPQYNLVQRDAERDLLPMARAFDLTITPWSPLANGLLTGKYNDRSGTDGRLAPGRSRNEVTERGLAVADVVMSVAAEIGCTPAQVALATHRRATRTPGPDRRRRPRIPPRLHRLAGHPRPGARQHLPPARRAPAMGVIAQPRSWPRTRSQEYGPVRRGGVMVLACSR